MEYAKGRVCTGFSYPLVAKYNAAGGAVSLSEAMVLARGVGVDLSINTASDNDFYADNALAETETGVFESGSLRLTVDGLFEEANRMIFGQKAAEEVTFGENKVKLTKYSANAETPYIAVGMIVEYKSNGKFMYVPTVFPKTKFSTAGLSAQTRGKTVSYQTQTLEAAIHRCENAEAEWKWVGEDFTTEAAAKTALNTIFGLKGA